MTGNRALDLRALARARRRPLAECLGNLPDEHCRRLVAFYEAHRAQNILKDAMRDRSRRGLAVENPAYLIENYTQVALQLQADEAGEVDGTSNDAVWKAVDASLVDLVTAVIGPVRRLRLSCLAPAAAIPHHVDDPAQVRVIAVLAGSHDFTFHLRDGDKAVAMRRGELWQVNTAYEHSVRNSGSGPRVALLANREVVAGDTAAGGRQ